MKKLIIADKEFDSRLFLGTGKFNSNEIMEQAILASGTEMVKHFGCTHGRRSRIRRSNGS